MARDLDLAGLGLLPFRKAHAKYAVVEIRGRSISCNRLRQRERAGERTVGTFHSVIIITFGLLLEFTLTSERQDIVLDRDQLLLAEGLP